VPLKAEAQELVNGSNVVYGGITEGYDLPDINIAASLNNTEIVQYTNISTETTPSHMAVFRTYSNTLLVNYTLNYSDGAATDGSASVFLGINSYSDLDKYI